MKTIVLHGKNANGRVTSVDDTDYEWLNQWRWQLSNEGYVQRGTWNKGKRVSYKMHRLIINTPKGFLTDHADGDKLNNQKYNLRVCTNAQNMMNQKVKDSASVYKGVTASGSKWVARIESRYIGTFRTEHQAAMAYDLWAIDMYGEFARTNYKAA